MARYIKVNSKVAKFLHLENDRLQVKDGNYILWQGDMLAFGPLPMLNDTLTKIGGISLLPHEAKQEQDGTECHVLPVATDERFVMEQTKADNTDADADAEAPISDDGGNSDETGDAGTSDEANESGPTDASDEDESNNEI